MLGGLQVDQRGLLANWMIPGKMVPGMGGAMDLVTGAKRVFVAMQHSAKGKSKIIRRVSLPLTSVRPVDLLVTELAAIGFPDGRATLLETAPGVTVEQADGDLMSGKGRAQSSGNANAEAADTPVNKEDRPWLIFLTTIAGAKSAYLGNCQRALHRNGCARALRKLGAA